jgi:hypothetical protein
MYSYTVCDMLDSMLVGCLYDEWQETVYKNPTMSIDERNDLFVSLSNEYGLSSYTEYEWTMVPHNFESPMYYISYAVSAAAALDLWKQSLTDRDGAIDRYMRLSASYDYGFRDTLNELGFDDIFEETSISSLCEAIRSYYYCGYDDISSEDWYFTAVRSTYDYLDNNSSEHFRPNDNATRIETANTIGRLFESSGNTIPDAQSAFNDDGGSKYVAWAADKGIIKGYNENTFGSSDTITREQAAAIIYRYCGGSSADDAFTPITAFNDSALISDWAYDAASWVCENSIFIGEPSENGEYSFDPQGTLTRAELAQIMTRVDKYMETQ